MSFILIFQQSFLGLGSFLRLFLALTLLMMLSPFLLVTVFCIALFDGLPVFFTSKRLGKNKRPFWMIKLRTMHRASFEDVMTQDCHPRITVLGKILRRFKIDELPQLWNIVRGDMNFFGPRPDVFSARHLYGPQDRFMFAQKPGLLDLASLVFAHEGKILSLSQKPEDLYSCESVLNNKKMLVKFYVEHQSPLMNTFLCGLLSLKFMSSGLFLRGLSFFCHFFGVPFQMRELCIFYARI